jgi:hypothetical protein
MSVLSPTPKPGRKSKDQGAQMEQTLTRSSIRRAFAEAPDRGDQEAAHVEPPEVRELEAPDAGEAATQMGRHQS